MTTATLTKRLAKFTGAKNSIAYKVALDLINKENKSSMVWGSLIRPAFVQGTGRHISVKNYKSDIISILDFLKIKYTTDNDAPRGGQTGIYINIETKIK